MRRFFAARALYRLCLGRFAAGLPERAVAFSGDAFRAASREEDIVSAAMAARFFCE